MDLSKANNSTPAVGRILRDLLKMSSAWLTAEEAKILRLYYGVGGDRRTLEEMAEMMHMERQAIRSKRNNALEKMAKAPNKTIQKFAEDLKRQPPPRPRIRAR